MKKIIRTVSPDDLARLKAAREDADRRYNEALTALDAAIQGPREMPHAPPAPDGAQVTSINERWNIADDTAADGWRGRLRRLAFRLVAPYFERQVAFNAALVDHVNRNLLVERETQRAVASTIAALERELHGVATFQSRLIEYLQQVTPYVDTKDYEAGGLARRLHEDNRELHEHNRELIDLLGERTVALGGAISGVGDELAKRWESMVARERRYDAKAASLTAAHEELRGTLAIVQQATNTIKRELERIAASPSPGSGSPGSKADTAASRQPPADGGGFDQAQATSIDSYKYVGFEERFRGSQEDIRSRLAEYLPFFEGASDVLDLGCGRGEFLDLLTEHGITCRGLDLNHEMVEVCRSRGLRVDEGDALGFLRGLPDGELGGLIAAQVVEHLQPDYLLALIDVAYHKLRPGSKIILETINPACWFAFFSSYIRDITHVRPLHPDTLSYFVQASGFQRVNVRYRAPYPEHEKLQRVTEDGPFGQAFNANVERLNGLLFTFLDYAVIGERL